MNVLTPSFQIKDTRGLLEQRIALQFSCEIPSFNSYWRTNIWNLMSLALGLLFNDIDGHNTLPNTYLLIENEN